MKEIDSMLGVTLLEQLLGLAVALSLLTYSIRHLLPHSLFVQQALLRHDLSTLQQQARDYFYQQGCDLRGHFRGKLRPNLSLLGASDLTESRPPWIAGYQVEIQLQPPLKPSQTCRAILRVLATLTPTGALNYTRALNSLSGGEALSASQLVWQQPLTPQRILPVHPLPQRRVL